MLIRVMLLFLCFITSSYAEDSNTLNIPTGKGLPVIVRTALYFINISSFDDDKGTFEAFTDLRLSWEDPRLRYPASEGLNGYKEYRASSAEKEIAKLWTPHIEFVNRINEPDFFERRLRIYPNGKVEIMTRTNAIYETPIDATRFPFDHQPLNIRIAVREDTVELVKLDFRQDDVSFSKTAKTITINGWNIGLVNLHRDLVRGWNGDRYSVVITTLDVERKPMRTLATIFIPLLASLLIPFLVIWMNKIEDSEFKVEAFELANVITGGLFAVIGLSFTINAEYTVIASNDNTVTRLFGLNYALLAISLGVVIMFFRYNLLRRWFGAYIQEQVFLFISWGFPLLAVSSALAFILVAAV
jgi:hypothetical protein